MTQAIYQPPLVQHPQQRNRGPLIAAAIATTVIGGGGLLFFNWSRVFPQKQIDAAFVVDKATADGFTGSLAALRRGATVEAGGGPPEPGCVPRTVQLIVAVGGVGLTCEIANALLKQRSMSINQDRNTIIVDTTTKKDSAVVHQQKGDTVVVIRKDGESLRSIDYSKDDLDCKKILDTIEHAVRG